MDDRAPKHLGLLWALAALALGVLLSMGLAPLAHAIPWSWERRLGDIIGMEALAKDCPPSAEAEAQLRRLVLRLYPLDPVEAAQPIDVKIVRDPSVNAFATLGSRIRVNSGLLEKAGSADEVAAVLAHEIEHLRHRHVMQGALVQLFSREGLRLVFGGSASAGLAESLLKMDFTRTQEIQADEAGLKRLQRAHVDARAMARFFERLQKDQPDALFFSDHPDNQARITMAESYATADAIPALTPEEWKTLKEKGCRH